MLKWLAIFIGTCVLWDLAVTEKEIGYFILAMVPSVIIVHELHQTMWSRKHPHQKNRH